MRMEASGEFGDAEEHNLILNLMALFAVRNPRMRESSRCFHEQLATQIMSLTVETKNRYERSIASAVREGYAQANDVTYDEMLEFVEGEQVHHRGVDNPACADRTAAD